MSNLKIAVLPGDGIGPEISRQGVAVLEAVADRFGHTFSFEYGLVGAAAIRFLKRPMSFVCGLMQCFSRR